MSFLNRNINVADSSLDIHSLFSKKRWVMRRTYIAAFVMILIVCILLALFLGNLWVDKNSASGSYIGKTQEQIIADLNAQVAEGEMNVSIANTIKFPDGTLNEGAAKIENIEANHVDQVVTIQLVDSGEVLYTSGAIEPGHYIQNITLNKDLEPGVYKARALFTGYRRTKENTIQHFVESITNIHQKVGALAAEINILVE